MRASSLVDYSWIAINSGDSVARSCQEASMSPDATTDIQYPWKSEVRELFNQERNLTERLIRVDGATEQLDPLC